MIRQVPFSVSSCFTVLRLNERVSITYSVIVTKCLLCTKYYACPEATNIIPILKESNKEKGIEGRGLN